MDLRYSAFDAAALELGQRLRRLESLFQHLLLQTGGDVPRALNALARLAQRYGFFDERLGLPEFVRWLERKSWIQTAAEGTPTLTSVGEQALRRSSLEAVFGVLGAGGLGEHRSNVSGAGSERSASTRPYRFGDALDGLDGPGSLRNALRRSAGADLELGPEDLEVFECEHATSCATVLAIDVSHSMILYGEDRFTPAKRVALALCELVRTRYPKDSLEVVLFGDEAWQLPAERLPYVTIGPYHTNTRAGLRLARELLRKKRHPNRQIVLLTDGKPSCLTEDDGTLYKNPFGLDRRIVNKTLEEAAWCRRLDIPITTFMLTADPTLVEFVERFTAENRGRAFYSGLDELSAFVLVDYVQNRQRRLG